MFLCTVVLMLKCTWQHESVLCICDSITRSHDFGYIWGHWLVGLLGCGRDNIEIVEVLRD